MGWVFDRDCALELWQGTMKLRPWNQARKIEHPYYGFCPTNEYTAGSGWEKGGSTGLLYSQDFLSLLAFSLTDNRLRTACHSTDFIMILCMDDRASLTLATWRPSDQSFYWAPRVSKVASLPPLMEPSNRFPKVSYFQPVYQTAIKIMSHKTKTGLSTALFHPVWTDWIYMHRT